MATSKTKTRKEKGGPLDNVLSKSAEGAKFLILLQIGSRALTFGVNQILLRYLTPSILGISTQLEVYQISVLFFARESLRVAAQRQSSSDSSNSGNGNPPSPDEKARAPDSREGTTVKRPAIPQGFVDASTTAGQLQTVVNLAYIPIYLGLPLAFGLGFFFLRSASAVVLSTPWFRESLHLYGVAAFWELLTEPCFLVVQQQMLFKIRARAETAATLARCFVTTGTAVYTARQGWDVGVLPFAGGQMAYGLLLLVVYYWQVWGVARDGGFGLSARRIFSKDPSTFVLSYFSHPLLSLGVTLFVQSGIKHVLTQGDSLLIAALSTIEDQGIYALVSNYGGLIARMLFQPIEESSRVLFANLLSSSDKAKSKANTTQAATTLALLLRFYALISLMASTIGPTAAPLLLNLLAGKRWAAAGAGDVLGTYCNYIPLLAINGVLEAFVSVTATSSQLRTQSLWMVGFSALFGAAGWFFLRGLEWGAEGLVWANAVNMAARIFWSGVFVRRYLAEEGVGLRLEEVAPKAASWAVATGTYAAMAKIRTTFRGDGLDIVRCGAIAVPSALLL